MYYCKSSQCNGNQLVRINKVTLLPSPVVRVPFFLRHQCKYQFFFLIAHDYQRSHSCMCVMHDYRRYYGVFALHVFQIRAKWLIATLFALHVFRFTVEKNYRYGFWVEHVYWEIPLLFVTPKEGFSTIPHHCKKKKSQCWSLNISLVSLILAFTERWKGTLLTCTCCRTADAKLLMQY